jgi:hypothetical protein
MSKPWKPNKKTVELAADAPRPSRIRRDPVAAGKTVKAVRPYPTEREVLVVVIGVILFALALTFITLGISAVTGP